LGYTIRKEDIFSNGHDCLLALTRHHYDLILLDIEMPILDGCQTTFRIRNSLPKKSCPTLPSSTSMNIPSVENYLSNSPSFSSSYLQLAQYCQKAAHYSSICSHQPSLKCSPSSSTFDLKSIENLTILPSNRNVPIIAVTSNAQDHQKQHFLNVGMNEVVEKPIREPQILLDLLNKYLSKSLKTATSLQPSSSSSSSLSLSSLPPSRSSSPLQSCTVPLCRRKSNSSNDSSSSLPHPSCSLPLPSEVTQA